MSTCRIHVTKRTSFRVDPEHMPPSTNERHWRGSVHHTIPVLLLPLHKHHNLSHNYPHSSSSNQPAPTQLPLSQLHLPISLLSPLCLSCLSLCLTRGGWGSIGSDFDRSPAIMLVLDALDEATRVFKGREGATNADAPAAKAKVAAISNFMVFVE